MIWAAGSPPSTPPARCWAGWRGRPGGCSAPSFDREAYKQRNTVERCINRLKQWRGIATRYEKTAAIYLAGLHIPGIFLWPAR
jgi:transposase